MHISDVLDTAPAAPAVEAYRDALAAFHARHVTAKGREGAVQAFHSVRNLPYFSGPDRTPLAALQSGRGACTAKHIVLRDLLRGLGYAAEVELVACDFAAAVPCVPSMPAALRAFVQAGGAQAGGVQDIHCWVRVVMDGDSLLLDATWPDSLAPYGFAVNTAWNGVGETRPVAAGGIVRATVEDVLASKAALLAQLPQHEADRRKQFLAALSEWLEGLDAEHEGGTQ